MRIAITGEKGFIARNMPHKISELNNTYVSLDNSTFAKEVMKYTENSEVCVHSNSVEDWTNLFRHLDLDVIIHNAAVVGTDVVALNPDESVMTNVLGTRKITEAANLAGCLNVYIGTTVIYDTYQYQETDITEESFIHPRTDYAVQKYAGEMFVKNNAKEWLVVRPLFAYGGEGDMNSLIAKSLFGVKNSIENIDMFLNPEKIKDYMHVEDFCHNVIDLINSNVRNNDFNVTAANPYNTLEIISMIEEVAACDLSTTLKWYPKTDYLGNHRLSNQKFVNAMGYSTSRTLKEGIRQSWHSIKNSGPDYNPLKYLEEAKQKNMNLEEFFPEGN
jgi:UDP-glucose 4-epimerase